MTIIKPFLLEKQEALVVVGLVRAICALMEECENFHVKGGT